MNNPDMIEPFFVALNRIPIVFSDDKDVIEAWDRLYESAINYQGSSEQKDDALITLLKELCRATGIKCSDWNDSRVTRVFMK